MALHRRLLGERFSPDYTIFNGHTILNVERTPDQTRLNVPQTAAYWGAGSNGLGSPFTHTGWYNTFDSATAVGFRVA